MKRAQFDCCIGRAAMLACLLASVNGCVDSESAGSDPAARAQTEQDAKNAMLKTSKKQSAGMSPQQSTRNAMEAGADSNRRGRSRLPPTLGRTSPNFVMSFPCFLQVL